MRDYAKKSQPSIKTKNNTDGSGILILFLCCAVLFVGFSAYHFVHKTMLAQNAILSHNVKMTVKAPIAQKHAEQSKSITLRKESKKAKVVVSEQMQPINNQPKYDFYKLLPKMTVVIPPENHSTSGVKTTVSTPTPSTYYLLQIASLASETDAKELQNSLKNSGYLSFIQHHQGPDKLTWFRVMVGPIYNLKTAETQQNKLYAHQMVAMLLKMQK